MKIVFSNTERKVERMPKVKEIFEKVVDVVQEIEATASNMTSQEKEDAAVAALNAVIDIPMMPEFIEGKILHKTLALLVQMTVFVLNHVGVFKHASAVETVAGVVEKVADVAAEKAEDPILDAVAATVGAVADGVENAAEDAEADAEETSTEETPVEETETSNEAEETTSKASKK